MAFWTLLLGGPAHLGLIGDKRHLPDTVKGQGDSCQRRQRLSRGWGWSSRAAPRSPANAQHRGRRRPGLSVRALSGLHRFTVWPGCPPRQALVRRSLRPLHAARLINTCAPARGLLRHDAQNPVSRTKTDPASEARPGTHRSRRLLVETQREAGRPPSSHEPDPDLRPSAVGSQARGLGSVFSREKRTRINVHLPAPTPGPEG